MIAFKASCQYTYGADFIVIAENITEAMIEVARQIEKRGGTETEITNMTIEKQNGLVCVTPSVMTQLEVEALTR